MRPERARQGDERVPKSSERPDIQRPGRRILLFTWILLWSRTLILSKAFSLFLILR
jgi:hypothetical protein